MLGCCPSPGHYRGSRRKQEGNTTTLERELAPSQVTAWKKELLSDGSSLFERKNAKNRETEEEKERTDALERTLGRVVVEKEFLIKKRKKLGIES